MPTMNEGYPENVTESTSEEADPDYSNYYIPLGFVAFVIVVVNSFIIILVVKNAKLRTCCNALLVSLAVADGTTGLIGIPVLMVAYLHTENIPIERICYLALGIHTWFWFMSVCSIFHLLVIACEQYLAILRPFSHDKIVTKKSVTITIFVIWTVSIVNSLIPWTWILPLGDYFCMAEDETVQRNDEIFVITSTALFFLLPLSIIIYVYFRIVMEAKCQIRRIKRECSIISQAAENGDAPPCIRFRGFFVIAIMWFVFVLCWTPYFVIVFLVTIHNKELPLWLDYNFLVLRLLPSVLNPLVFAFWKKDFRSACIHIFYCCHKPTEQPVSAVSARQKLLNRLSDTKIQSV